MPPRLRLISSRTASQSLGHEAPQRSKAAIAAVTAAINHPPQPSHRSMATAAATKASASRTSHLSPPSFPAAQPPSHRSPEFRKSQLIRQYTAQLRTMPLVLLLQHHNVRSKEWAGIRRELAHALRKVDEYIAAQGRQEPPLADMIKLQIVQTNMFETALRLVEHFRPEQRKQHLQEATAGLDTTTAITSADDPRLTHDLSRTAYHAVRGFRGKIELSTLLTGPVATVSFPVVSPEHLKAALSILSPKAPVFPAPRRKARPGYHELSTQEGLRKLMLLGARVEGKVFDDEETRWVGSIEGGMQGLRAQLVAALQGVGASLTGTLEGASKSVYFTLESRRSAMEEEQKGDSGNSAS